MARCSKIRYRDELAAKIVLTRIKKRDRTDRPKQEGRSYKCPKCRGWHLTSMT